MEIPFVNQQYLLEKFQGKGGWTYAQIPEIRPDKHAHFGWVRVRGHIDSYEIKGYHLMPMGNGNLFLPVKAQIRKHIKKQAGDWVHIILYADNAPTEIPADFLWFLQDEPELYQNFMTFSDAERKAYIEWIEAAKTVQTKANRMAVALQKIQKKQKIQEATK
ncbi:MAG: DUF1905 domain-containing protein [Bacteroidetes bacterium]|nr:DUF1905 domain-containing protein [Bacteroidota bacterium]